MTRDRATVKEGARRADVDILSDMIQKSVAATNLPDLLGHLARMTSEGLDAAWVTIWPALSLNCLSREVRM